VTSRFPFVSLVLVLAAGGCGAGGGHGSDDLLDARDAGADGEILADVPDTRDFIDGRDQPEESTEVLDVRSDAAADVPDAAVPDPAFRRIDLTAVGDVMGMWSAPGGTAWAVGKAGLVLRSDGDAFLPVFPRPPGDADLFGISGDGDTIFVVGAGGVVMRLNPVDGWTVLRQADGSDLYGVSAVSATEAWMVGKGGRILKFKDGEFTAETTGITHDLYGINASAAGGVRAVGAFGTLLERGSAAWVRSDIAGPATTLRAIWRAPDGRMVAVGSRGSVALFDGMTWLLQVTNDPEEPGRDLFAIGGTASNDVTAVGDRGALVHFDGERWSMMTVAGPYNGQADLRGIASRIGSAGKAVSVAAGLGSTALELQDDAWYDRMLGVTTDLRGVAVDGGGSLVIVGAGGLILRGPADRLGAIRQSVPGALNAVSLPWVVGDGGAVVDLSGEFPTLLSASTDEDLLDVWADKGGAWIVGARGSVFRLAAGALTLNASRSSPLYATCSDGEMVWIAGDGGIVEVDAGEGFRALTSGTSSTLRDMMPLAGGGVVVAGDHGLILECDVSGCQRVVEEPGTFLYGLGDMAGSGMAVGWAGTVLRRASGGGWYHLDSGTKRVFNAVAGSADGTFAALAGSDGVLFIYSNAAVTAE
jgi:hypothetical protein